MRHPDTASGSGRRRSRPTIGPRPVADVTETEGATVHWGTSVTDTGEGTTPISPVVLTPDRNHLLESRVPTPDYPPLRGRSTNPYRVGDKNQVGRKLRKKDTRKNSWKTHALRHGRALLFLCGVTRSLWVSDFPGLIRSLRVSDLPGRDTCSSVSLVARE